MRSLSTAGTGMLAQQTNVDVISHNIANMNTTGYKRQRAEFQDLLYQNVSRPGSASGGAEAKMPTGIQVGAGVKTAGIYRISEQGALSQTDNRYDLGIQGRGYFAITLPSGETGYTRDGSFQLSDQGELVTVDGFAVQLSWMQIAITVTTLVVLAAFTWLVSATSLGRSMRACEQDRKMAGLLGIDTDRTISLTFVLGAMLAAVAGLLFLLYYGVIDFFIGFVAGVKAFTAAVLGGIGSLPGAVLGGLAIGLIETFWSAYASAQYKDVAAFSILIVVLIFLPTGLLGRQDVEKV